MPTLRPSMRVSVVLHEHTLQQSAELDLTGLPIIVPMRRLASSLLEAVSAMCFTYGCRNARENEPAHGNRRSAMGALYDGNTDS